MQRLQHIESNYYHYFQDLVFLFYFSAIWKNLYMMTRFFFGLFFEDGTTINQHYQK